MGLRAIRRLRRNRQRILDEEGENHPIFCHSPSPSLDEIARALLAVPGRYVEFRYDTLPECRRPMTPSRALAQADTRCLGPLDMARGFPGGNDGGGVGLSRPGNWLVTLRSMNRKKRLPTGQGYYHDKTQGEHLWRSYRLEGIDLTTVMVNMGRGRGKVRMFPAVAPVDSAYVEMAAVGI